MGVRVHFLDPPGCWEVGTAVEDVIGTVVGGVMGDTDVEGFGMAIIDLPSLTASYFLLSEPSV